MVNIFTDLYYLTFVQELNKSLSGWQPTILPNSTCLQITLNHHAHTLFLLLALDPAVRLCSSSLSSLSWRRQCCPAVFWGLTVPHRQQSQPGLCLSSFCFPE